MDRLWTQYIETVYTCCRGRWDYRIPEGEADRALLRRLCRETLAFENAYLERYCAYLLDQLRADSDEARLVALRRLGDDLPGP